MDIRMYLLVVLGVCILSICLCACIYILLIAIKEEKEIDRREVIQGAVLVFIILFIANALLFM